jgi:hypothetical protein
MLREEVMPILASCTYRGGIGGEVQYEHWVVPAGKVVTVEYEGYAPDDPAVPWRVRSAWVSDGVPSYLSDTSDWFWPARWFRGR